MLRACLCIRAAARMDGGGAGTLGEADSRGCFGLGVFVHASGLQVRASPARMFPCSVRRRDICAQSAGLWAERATSGTGARNTKACCGYLPLPPAPPLPSRSVSSVFLQVKADLLDPPPPSLPCKGVHFVTETGEEDEAAGESAEGGGGPGRLRLRSVGVGVGGAGRRRAGIIYSSQRADWLYEQRVPSQRKSQFVFGIVKIQCVCLRARADMRTRF